MMAIAVKRNYRPDELAAEMDVTVVTVYRWINEGLIKHRHRGRLICIPREEFLRAIEQGVERARAR